MAERWADRLSLTPRAAEPRWCLQGPAPALDKMAQALAQALGLPEPAGVLAQLSAPAATWLRLGPGEAWWLGPAPLPPALQAPWDAWQARGAALACTDLSDAWVGWDLRGAGWAECLAQGCALDFEALGPTCCARTRLAQAPAVLAPLREGCALWTERSHGAYVQRWLGHVMQQWC